MDPYDDFDPQAYDYDESSQEEDDIVYLEGPVPADEDPFLPYLAKDVDLSQTQSSQPEQQHVPNLLPRRERQRRRTEAVAQMMGESSESELSNDPAEEDEQDTFASLQSLLDKQSQQEKEKALNADETESSQKDAGADETMPAARTSTEEKGEPTEDGNVTFMRESQSQFPMADDWEPTQANPTQSVPLISSTSTEPVYGSSISSGLAKELQRRKKQKHISSQPLALVDPPSTVDKNLLSELEKNRKRAQKKATSKPKKRIANTKGARPHFHRNSAPTQVSSSKSIVGSRPQHWGAARTPGLSVPKTRKLAASPKSSHLAASGHKQTRPRSTLSQPTKSSFLKNSKSGRSPTEAPNRISFAPHFFHTKQNSSQQDDVDDVNESTQRSDRGALYQTPRILQRFNQNSSAAYSAGSSNGSASNSRKRKQNKKLKAGPLMKRLRALRSAVDGDTIRFQSGMYPFAAQSAHRRFDLSDPRNRATSFLDVSIVCDPVPWDEQERKITALCFIHNSEKVSKSADDNTVILEGSRFAWLSFTYDTAREQNVCKGSQLRIYHTVSVPSSEPIQMDGLGEDNVVEDRSCDQTILCTQLCESYPDSLPALPNVMDTIKHGS